MASATARVKKSIPSKHPDLTAAQDAMTRKIVEALQEFDNVFYEICNEPTLAE